MYFQFQEVQARDFYSRMPSFLQKSLENSRNRAILTSSVVTVGCKACHLLRAVIWC